jgi:hypothetical protein
LAIVWLRPLSEKRVGALRSYPNDFSAILLFGASLEDRHAGAGLNPPALLHNKGLMSIARVDVPKGTVSFDITGPGRAPRRGPVGRGRAGALQVRLSSLAQQFKAVSAMFSTFFASLRL